eukprot:scaffold1346_cov354-Pavlova_lutheri.AAC.2
MFAKEVLDFNVMDIRISFFILAILDSIECMVVWYDHQGGRTYASCAICEILDKADVMGETW